LAKVVIDFKPLIFIFSSLRHNSLRTSSRSVREGRITLTQLVTLAKHVWHTMEYFMSVNVKRCRVILGHVAASSTTPRPTATSGSDSTDQPSGSSQLLSRVKLQPYDDEGRWIDQDGAVAHGFMVAMQDGRLQNVIR
jgi:hypothetical protein